MSFTTPDIAWAPLTPILVVLIAAAVGVLLEAFIAKAADRRLVQVPFTLLALVTGLFALVWQWIEVGAKGRVVFNGMIEMDRQSLAWQFLILVFAIGGVLLAADKSAEGEDAFAPLASVAPGSTEETLARAKGLQLTEVFPLMLFATGGMMLFTAVSDLLFLFVALELFSLPLYILVALARRRRLLSQEAALKYFLLGAFSSAIYLFGVALVYGATGGETSMARIGAYLPYNPDRRELFLLALFLVLVGLLFKLGAVPFHLWVPDAYQGAPTPVTAFMAAATKAAAVAALARLSYLALFKLAWDLNWVFWTVAIASMVFGTVLAIVQTDIKRMLAYSSIAHAGFILVAFAGFSPSALSALPFYMAAYGAATLGAFAVITQVRELTPDGATGAEATRLGQWAGLGKRNPLLAAAMTLFLLSFAGIPLTAGFIGKFVAFKAAIEQGAWPLVLVAVVTSGAAAFFYVRVAVLMFFTDAPEDASPKVADKPTGIGRGVVIASAIAVIVLGVVPGWALHAAEQAASLLLPNLGVN